jgi:hypothetical protein
MKTVPSGRSDFCIKAAPAVSGTFMSGIPIPASVGAPTRLKTLVDSVWAAVLEGASPVLAASVVSELAACEVVAASDVAGCDVAGCDVSAAEVSDGAFVAASPPGCVTVDRSGAFSI